MPHDTDLAPRTSGHAHHAHGLWRHYAEMVAAMFVGMLVLGTMRDLPMAFTVGAHVVMLVLMFVVTARQHGGRTA